MKNIIALFTLLSLSGCATVFSGTTQNVNVKVVDSKNNDLLTDISCIIHDPNGGSNVVNSNPGVANIAKGHGSLDIKCSKDGYRQLNTAVGNSFNGVTLVNVLFLPGFIVDAATGAYKKYPSHYVVSMEKISVSKK